MRDVFAEVKKDIDGRNLLGKHNYGGELDAIADRRDWLSEAYMEALDLCVYLKAQLMRREVEDSASTGNQSRQSRMVP